MKRIASLISFFVAFLLAITPVVHSQPRPELSKVFPINQLPSGDFVITLTGKETFQKLVKAGKYDSVDEELLDINPKQSPSRKIETNLTLVTFFQDFPIEEIPARLAKLGLRPATLIELLAFGAQYPGEQLLQGRPILSPGATLEFVDTYDDEEKLIRKHHIYLRGVSDKRILGINYAGSFWNKNWRCLAAQLTEAETKKGR